ncbi:uncharacterized protein BJ212DRAFT_1265332, partial [Suillus subaureus]
HATITEIKSQSGFSWDEELGANIGPTDAAWWTAFANACPDTKPFRNKGWKHFDDMDDLLHVQIMRVLQYPYSFSYHHHGHLMAVLLMLPFHYAVSSWSLLSLTHTLFSHEPSFLSTCYPLPSLVCA